MFGDGQLLLLVIPSWANQYKLCYLLSGGQKDAQGNFSVENPYINVTLVDIPNSLHQPQPLTHLPVSP